MDYGNETHLNLHIKLTYFSCHDFEFRELWAPAWGSNILMSAVSTIPLIETLHFLAILSLNIRVI
jgi:hypothetical protein